MKNNPAADPERVQEILDYATTDKDWMELIDKEIEEQNKLIDDQFQALESKSMATFSWFLGLHALFGAGISSEKNILPTLSQLSFGTFSIVALIVLMAVTSEIIAVYSLWKSVGIKTYYCVGQTSYFPGQSSFDPFLRISHWSYISQSKWAGLFKNRECLNERANDIVQSQRWIVILGMSLIALFACYQIL